MIGIDPGSRFFAHTAMPDREWWRVLWPAPQQVIASFGVDADDEAVDLCCGDGLFTLPLARRARRVTAIDLNPVPLELARREIDAAGLVNCRFVAADAHDLARLVPRADFILIANALHGVADKTTLASTIADVLAPGGRLAVINWHALPIATTMVLGAPRGPGVDLRMPPQAVAAIGAAAGLPLERVVELPPFHYGAILRKAQAKGRGNDA